MAQTLSGTVKYRMPFTSSGVDLMAADCVWNTQASVSDSTLTALIWSSGLKRRPE